MKQGAKKPIVIGTLVLNIAEAWAKKQKWTDVILRIKSNTNVSSEPPQGEMPLESKEQPLEEPLEQPLEEPQDQPLEVPQEQPLEEPQEQVSDQDLSSSIATDKDAVAEGPSATEMDSSTDINTPEMKATTGVNASEQEPLMSNDKTRPNYVEFPCHKFILSGRSPVFKAMLESGNVDVLELEDITPKTVNTLLNFIYTDTVARKFVDTHLLAAADRFGMDGLKNICSKVLCPRVSVENAIDLFLVARMTKVKTLEERAR